MSGIRILVGTKKGAFILTSDGKRRDWSVSGPHFGGWEIYHVNSSPVDSDRIYASQSTGWFGQVIQRSNDGGKSWHEISGKLRAYRSRTGGNDREALTRGLSQENCYVNVLRDGMAVDTLDPCGIYFSTTGGQVYASVAAPFMTVGAIAGG